MKKKTILILALLFFNIFSMLYLISPTPQLQPLPYSIKSDLPGDTVQIKNVSAYFTNLTRQQVINHYRATYTSPFRIRLNHPPEKAQTIFVDTIKSYYLEEFVLPGKETLYINGFEWEKDVFTKPEKRIKNKILYQDKQYKAKITIRTFPVPISHRLISFFLTQSAIIVSLHLYYSLLKKKK